MVYKILERGGGNVAFTFRIPFPFLVIYNLSFDYKIVACGQVNIPTQP